MAECRPRLFCFGLGYSACALVRSLRAEGWRIAGTTQDAARAEALRREGFEMFEFNRGRPLADETDALAGTTHLLSSVPPDRDGDPVLDHHAREIGGIPGLVWAGYLSTTGVYGDTGGVKVSEKAPLQPTVARSRRRLSAERRWTALWRESGVPVHVFRLAGIYGPGRSAFDQIAAGRAKRIHRPGYLFSRIHVTDIANVLRASMRHPNPGAVYNVCDDEPSGQSDVVAFACELLGIDPPPLVAFEEARKTLSPMALSFWSDNRRIDNSRIKDELNVRLQYPDYRAGLEAIFAVERRLVP